MTTAPRQYHRVIGAASLIVGPALMSVGDLFHPPESWDPAVQVAMVAAAPSRWYAAHLLLFMGMLLFVPGILALTALVADRRPALGYVARVLMLAAVGALSAVFGFEMLLGRFVAGGAGQAAAVTLLETFMGPAVFAVLMPGLLAFFVGTGLAVAPLASSPGSLRGPALVFALGTALILAEIISAQVVLSQIGNVLCLAGGWWFARVLRRGTALAAA
ncbi:MAG TPA: hypothetical protein VFI41_06970 [Gemmatimonadales bacterium]|nr:hypothetical protein [Gemmatimonadales bacterium]